MKSTVRLPSRITVIFSLCAIGVESLRARRAGGACTARPACNSGPASSPSCSRTPFVRIMLRPMLSAHSN
ncbi:hypothetical protein Y032_0007g3558 [Ancylostoma ceylanicum]|uniref:Uncharacterized protein n=1 Tax=Ancylostoma ceylanicum TaxID=53326 RepID=A0A016VP36_9BILA|nr:hypothetical protein Y032_0007g3558 [Ancylostoma ceylanicum]